MKNLINFFIVIVLFLLFILVLKVANERQVKKDCLKAQRHLINYNVPISEDLNSLCVELKYYE